MAMSHLNLSLALADGRGALRLDIDTPEPIPAGAYDIVRRIHQEAALLALYLDGRSPQEASDDQL